MGIFYRTIRMAENGIKPVYVFDGKPPDLKKGVVSLLHASIDHSLSFVHLYSSRNDTKSEKMRRKMERKLKKLVRGHLPFQLERLIWSISRTGTVEDMDRQSRRTVKVTKEHNEECRRLLKLMGIPYVEVSSAFHIA